MRQSEISPTTETRPPARLDLDQHALFLDFDGTLAPLVDHPDDAAMPERTRQTLIHLRERTNGALAIVSGRALADLAPRLPDSDFALAGSHGHEIRHPGDPDAAAPTLAAPLEAAEARLHSFAQRHNLRMERKPGALTLHYRGMPHLEEAVRDTVRTEAAAHDGVTDLHGNMVSELVIAGGGKGSAIRTFLDRAPFRGRSPVMIGDDVTDEHGFDAAQALGGFGLKIGAGPTCARHRLDSVPSLADWLHAIADPGSTD
ncbi:Trehalose-6-phosphate phosphatase [Roseivivax jejudonensis]|uniref:Trehalose 6-phosphate phosphatase n=1 Tax=Roseivivax jejudonensis TaxID=1529041 RepID=A0A1X6Y748_9RHOB|nr:trehalose-phosphatase [Roseivivax jejudonensis]SLN12348.1 Trehalose-6-phosphate phosphatase [Roseivivax jejudonensis]